MISWEAWLDERLFARLDEMRASWEDEAADASLAGNPQRAGYLEHMAARVPAWFKRDERGMPVMNRKPPPEPPALPSLARPPALLVYAGARSVLNPVVPRPASGPVPGAS